MMNDEDVPLESIERLVSLGLVRYEWRHGQRFAVVTEQGKIELYNLAKLPYPEIDWDKAKAKLEKAK